MKKNTKSTQTDSAADLSGFRLIDFLVIFIFLSVAAIAVGLFMKDLMQTINLRNVDPVGHVIIRKNIVQRRLVDRVLWDRLSSQSPVYLGDLIRVAELSAATLYIDGNSIDLDENTLIRLTRAADGATLRIIMDEGSLSLASAADSSRISLDIGGMQVEMTAGGSDNLETEGGRTVLNVTSAQDGVTLQVNQGTAQLVEAGRTRQLAAGNQLSRDADGALREDRAVVVMTPAGSAHYVNDSRNPLLINFSWNRINLDTEDLLLLEIASDRNFNRIIYRNETADSLAHTVLANGLWYWRISYERKVLSDGRFTIINGTGPRLQSPASSSIFKYTDELPTLSFRWARVDEASSYTIEISDSPDFVTSQIQRQSQSTFLTEASLGEGTWYWRVKPEFPPIYTGNSSFSQASHFIIERTITTVAAAQLSLEDWYAAELPPEKPALPVLHLTAPAQRSDVDGLMAIQHQVVFVWEFDSEITSSRFFLSRNPNPVRQPSVIIENPDKTVSVNRLGIGAWYWNVEVQTPYGSTIIAPEHGVFQIMPIPLLPAAENLQPVNEHRFTMNDLMARRSISFSWDTVSGANAYILTIYQQAAGRRFQVFRTQPLTQTSYLLEDLRFLDRGTFVWEIEAVNRGQNNTIYQRGRTSENSFVMEIILPSRIQIDGIGVVDGS